MDNTRYMKFGDVQNNMDIIPTDENGNPVKVAPMSGILDWFKKKEAETQQSTCTYVNGVKSDLSVVTMTQDEYVKLVTQKAVDPNVVYVVTSDHVNAYGQQIANVASPVDANDAATKGYVDNAVSANFDKIAATQNATMAALAASYAQMSQRCEALEKCLSGIKAVAKVNADECTSRQVAQKLNEIIAAF